jgi:putative transcriptional regulator
MYSILVTVITRDFLKETSDRNWLGHALVSVVCLVVDGYKYCTMETVTKVKLNPKESILKQIRQELGMTQEEFAKSIKAHRVSVAKWETGRQPSLTIPQIKALQREMRKIGLDFSDLPDDFS